MPRHAQTGHTWHKSALSHLFSDHPKQSYAGHAKRAQKANLCQQQRECPSLSPDQTALNELTHIPKLRTEPPLTFQSYSHRRIRRLRNRPNLSSSSANNLASAKFHYYLLRNLRMPSLRPRLKLCQTPFSLQSP